MQVVLAAKKDETKHFEFCIDFCWLNDVMHKDAYPLPRIEGCMDALNGSRYFSSMDLLAASGYWQVAMDPKDRDKMLFSTHVRLFEWSVMPFGLSNALVMFKMCLMEQVLADIMWSRCLVYLDDIDAFGVTFHRALLNLRSMFDQLRGANLKLKPKKCDFFRDKLEYLGHEVSREGIKPSL